VRRATRGRMTPRGDDDPAGRFGIPGVCVTWRPQGRPPGPP
jgi:hypothetical protein